MNKKKGIEAKENGEEINKKSETFKIKTELDRIEEQEDATKYGEFISSYFGWNTLKNQKQRAEKLEKITQK